MNQQSPKEKAETLIDALERYGQGDYIGESISQLEHCLQAAHQASQASAYCS
jgi:predicted HD phosphohydrolase